MRGRSVASEMLGDGLESVESHLEVWMQFGKCCLKRGIGYDG